MFCFLVLGYRCGPGVFDRLFFFALIYLLIGSCVVLLHVLFFFNGIPFLRCTPYSIPFFSSPFNAAAYTRGISERFCQYIYQHFHLFFSLFLFACNGKFFFLLRKSYKPGLLRLYTGWQIYITNDFFELQSSPSFMRCLVIAGFAKGLLYGDHKAWASEMAHKIYSSNTEHNAFWLFVVFIGFFVFCHPLFSAAIIPVKPIINDARNPGNNFGWRQRKI